MNLKETNPVALGNFGYGSCKYREFPCSEVIGELEDAAFSAIGHYEISKKDGEYEGLRINTPYLGKYYSLPKVTLSVNPDKSKNLISEGKMSHIGAIVTEGCSVLPEGSEVMLYFKNKNLRSKKIGTNLIDPGEPIPVISMTSEDIGKRMACKLFR